MTVLVNRYERDSKAREKCIQHHGCRCQVCDFDFEAVYGPIGEGYIYVHHLVLISSIGEDYVVDPVNDLKPVCPNCHAMLHRRTPPYSMKNCGMHYRLALQLEPVSWVDLKTDHEENAHNPDGRQTAPTPNAKGLSGKVKFLTRDNGIQLGYMLKIPVEFVPTEPLPLKDQQETKLPDSSTFGPPDQLHLEGQFDFVLKDADGFELQRISALQENLTAGSDNERQGTAERIISPSVVERTKMVEVSFLTKSCYPCR